MVRFLVSVLFLVLVWILTWQKEKRASSLVPSYQDTNFIHENSTLMAWPPPKDPTIKYYHSGDSTSAYEFWEDTNLQSITFHKIIFSFFFLDFIYLFLESREGREKERKETWRCGCLTHTPNWGPGPHPRHVLWLGIKLVTLWFAGPLSIHWATPSRAIFFITYF